MNYDQFMHYSMNEIYIILNAHQKKKELEYKSKIYENYALSQNIGVMIGCILNSKPFPNIEDLYPNLFKPKEQDEELMFLQFKELADAMNKDRKEKQSES